MKTAAMLTNSGCLEYQLSGSSEIAVMSGDWRDSLVARDILIGCAFGILIVSILFSTTYFVPPLFGYAEIIQPFAFQFATVMGIRFFISGLMGQILAGIFVGLLLICLLLILRTLLRNQKAAFILLVLIWSLPDGLSNIWLFPIVLVLVSIYLFVLMRFGLVAVALTMFLSGFFQIFPTTLDTSAWYSDVGFAALAILAVIVLYAFRTSLAGRPLFGTPRLDE